MNVFILSFGEINHSPHENILTIALTNIHYLYTVARLSRWQLLVYTSYILTAV